MNNNGNDERCGIGAQIWPKVQIRVEINCWSGRLSGVLANKLDECRSRNRVVRDRVPTPAWRRATPERTPDMHEPGVQTLQTWRMPSQEPLTSDELELSLQRRQQRTPFIQQPLVKEMPRCPPYHPISSIC